jgi:adenosylmethionine-8-amino-7-oxononanoate aminotransferase
MLLIPPLAISNRELDLLLDVATEIIKYVQKKV